MLAAEELLWLAAEPVPEVRVVDVPVMQAKALPVEPHGPVGCVGQQAAPEEIV